MEVKNIVWKCQACGKPLAHNPKGTSGICIECGGTRQLAPMGAKDIAVSLRKSVELPENRSLLNMLDFADEVAEISFKAGQREPLSKDKLIIEMRREYEAKLNSVKQIGIKEVVDDMEEAISKAKIRHTISAILVCLEKWQAKLKK